MPLQDWQIARVTTGLETGFRLIAGDVVTWNPPFVADPPVDPDNPPDPNDPPVDPDAPVELAPCLMYDRWSEDGLEISDAGEQDQNKRELYFLKADLVIKGVTLVPNGWFTIDGERWDFALHEPICTAMIPLSGIQNMVYVRIRKAVELNNASPGGAWGYDLEG